MAERPQMPSRPETRCRRPGLQSRKAMRSRRTGEQARVTSPGNCGQQLITKSAIALKDKVTHFGIGVKRALRRPNEGFCLDLIWLKRLRIGWELRRTVANPTDEMAHGETRSRP